MSAADVRSLQALERLDPALGAFGAQVRDAARSLETEFGPQEQRMLRHEEAAEEEVRRCREAYEAADEDDEDYWRDCLDDAREHRARVRAWRVRIDDERRSLSRHVSRVGAIESRVVSGRTHLRTLIEDLRAYHSIGLDVGASGHAPPPGHAGQDYQPVSAAAVALRGLPIPDGFEWVALDEIDLVAELDGIRSPADYTKVSYDDMQRGMELLRTGVLPAIQANPSRGVDYFRFLDEQNHRSGPTALGNVYSAFFGGDAIKLDRREGERFSVTNGRHRLHLAQTLGWDAIPARTSTLPAQQSV